MKLLQEVIKTGKGFELDERTLHRLDDTQAIARIYFNQLTRASKRHPVKKGPINHPGFIQRWELTYNMPIFYAFYKNIGRKKDILFNAVNIQRTPDGSIVGKDLEESLKYMCFINNYDMYSDQSRQTVEFTPCPDYKEKVDLTISKMYWHEVNKSMEAENEWKSALN